MARNPYQQRKKGGVHHYEHRKVAEEEILGRPLEPGEVTHHEDGDKRNNARDNLKVFKSHSHHMRYHHFRNREERGVIHLFDVEVWLEL